MNPSEQNHTLSPTLNEEDLQAMADSQEAEALLFQYIVISAGQLETPPVILKKLAANLGDPQRLPATQILQIATQHPLAHPLGTLIAMEGILENTFEDSAASFEKELAFSQQQDHSTPWITLENPGNQSNDTGAQRIDSAQIADPSLHAKPLVERKRQRIFPVGKIFVIGLAILYGYMVLKTGSLSPWDILDSLKNQRSASTHTMSPPPPSDTVLPPLAEPSPADAGATSTVPPYQEARESGDILVKQSADYTSDVPPPSNAVHNLNPSADKGENALQNRHGNTADSKDNDDSNTGTLRHSPHPDVVTLPSESVRKHSEEATMMNTQDHETEKGL